MYKNAVDVIFGGTVYFLVGFGLSYGTSPKGNEFAGWGDFALAGDDDRDSPAAGDKFVNFVFQVSSKLPPPPAPVKCDTCQARNPPPVKDPSFEAKMRSPIGLHHSSCHFL